MNFSVLIRKQLGIIAVFAVSIAVPGAFGQQPPVKPFGISDADFPGVTLATVVKFSSDSQQYFTGMGTVIGPLAVPRSTNGIQYVAIFKADDWRIAAFCEAGSIYAMHPCHSPDRAEAWIRLRKNASDLSVLFINPKKTITKADAEKAINSKFTVHVDLWTIIAVRNVKSGQSWPQSLEDAMKK
jgi:hypothetical protein